MTKEELLAQIHFNNKEERKKAEFYLEMKGIAFHKSILDYLCANCGKTIPVEWSDLSNELRSDKALRDILYKYLATLEEYIRAYISNKYENDAIQQVFWVDESRYDYNKIKTQLVNGKPLSKTLEDVDFGTLIKQVKDLPEFDRKQLFGDVGTDDNLDAVKDLRNAVSHHKFLRLYSLKTCNVDGNESDSLFSNIRNLRQLLPMQYRFGENGMGGITADLEKIGVLIQKDNIIAFIFDSGKLGVSYGSVVFENMLSGGELSTNPIKVVVSWGDIFINKRYIDIEPYIYKDEMCTIDFKSIGVNNAFLDLPYCWIVEDLNESVAFLIDKRLKQCLNGYIGMFRINKQSSSKKKQFWKDMIRSISIQKKVITCFQNPDLSDIFCYEEAAINLGYTVGYAKEAEFCPIEESPTMQSSCIKSDSDLLFVSSKNTDIDRDLWTMNFSLRQELQISGVLIWKSIYEIDKIDFKRNNGDESSMIEHQFLSLYYSSQGIERIQKAIIELICKRNHILDKEKDKVYELLKSHSHDGLNTWIEKQTGIKLNDNCRNFVDIIMDFYNNARYSRYSDDQYTKDPSREYHLLYKLSPKNDPTPDTIIKNNFGKYLGDLAQTYYKIYTNLCNELNIFAYEIESDSDALIVYHHRDDTNLYKELKKRRQAKKELLYWLIKNGKSNPSTKKVKEPVLSFDPHMINDYLYELVSKNESIPFLYDIVSELYDELYDENKQAWKDREEIIDYFVANPNYRE